MRLRHLIVLLACFIACGGAPLQDDKGASPQSLKSDVPSTFTDQQAAVKTENEKPIVESASEIKNDVEQEVEKQEEEKEQSNISDNDTEGKDDVAVVQDLEQWEYPDEQNTVIPEEWRNNPTLRRWLYYHLLENRRRKRHVAGHMPVHQALTAEDMHSGRASGMRVKRGAYYEPFNDLGFDPSDLGYMEELDAEPFEDMSEEELVKALKVLHGLYREELERIREEEALKEYMNSIWQSNYEPQEEQQQEYASLSRASHQPRKVQGSYISMVPGSKRVYREEGWWGNFVDHDKDEQRDEYERILELANALKYN